MNYVLMVYSVVRKLFNRKAPVAEGLLLVLLIVLGAAYGYTKYKNLEKQNAELQQSMLQYQTLFKNREQELQKFRKLYIEQKADYETRIKKYENTIDNLKKLYLKEQNRTKVVVKYRTKVIYVDKNEDGYVAPVLRNTFNWLRGQMRMPAATASSDNSNKNKIH